MTLHVYVAGPMRGKSETEQADLVLSGIREAAVLAEAGLFVFVPHLFFHMAPHAPRMDIDRWLALDFAWILRCDWLLRLPGFSRGADAELAFAQEHGLSVFCGTASEFLAHLERKP